MVVVVEEVELVVVGSSGPGKGTDPLHDPYKQYESPYSHVPSAAQQ